MQTCQEKKQQILRADIEGLTKQQKLLRRYHVAD